MAARQDQGLQITLIVFVFLFVVCAAMSFLFYKYWGESEVHVAELTSQLQKEKQNASKAQGDKESFAQWMGVGLNDNADDVKKTYDDDMKKYGSTFDPSQQNYRAILAAVYDENGKIAARESEAKNQLKDTKERLMAVESENAKQLAQYKDQMQKSAEDSAALRGSFEQDRKQLEATKKDLQEKVDAQQARFETEIGEKEANVKALTDKLAKSDKAKENLMAQVKQAAVSFEVPDGRVSWVNQDGTVWINLGSADSLRRQITFSVLDADTQDPVKDPTKGSIEITRILGDHLAEARITKDDAKNPILAGDQVYSQVWHRGKKLHFALTGVIDVDGDGRSDMQLARELIDLNGGTVDAYLSDEGQVEGEITVNTRYLVLGKHPEEGNQAKLRDGWQKMSEEARTNGVETITLDKFLNEMGYSPTSRTVQMGAGAKASDFPAGPDITPMPGNPQGRTQFRARSPVRPSATPVEK